MKKTIVAFSVILVVAFTAAACSKSSNNNGTQNQSTSSPQVTATASSPAVSPNVTASVQSQLDTKVLKDNLKNINSYKLVIKVVTTGTSDNNTTRGNIRLEEAFVKDPPASQKTMYMEVDGTEQTFMQIVTLNNKTWLKMQGTGTWIQQPASTSESMFQQQLGIDIMTTEDAQQLSDFNYLGTETVNGIKCRHYTYKGSYVSSIQANIEAWVTDDSKFPQILLKQIIKTQRNVGDKTEIYNYTYEFTEINTSIKIEEPKN